MFTGIIETIGLVESVRESYDNIEIGIKTDLLKDLEVDQSIAHNGVCLTVETISKDYYTVTAIRETIEKTNIGSIKSGDKINLERCLKVNGRLDGHIVQGHVDQTAFCKNISDENGSWIFTFEHEKSEDKFTVEKGSICVNGLSLTVVNALETSFSTAIIPYSFENTNFHMLEKGDVVNLEFDIIGKYLERILRERL